MRERGSAARGERGMSTVEVVFIAPLIMLFILVLVSFGQTVSGRSAARDAARAGSLERSAGEARAAAEAIVTDQLADICVDDPLVDGRGFELGGLYTVEVSCEVRGMDLMGIGLETTMTGTSSSPVDPYRRIEE
jgi:Flp pilus assembly protein TadG